MKIKNNLGQSTLETLFILPFVIGFFIYTFESFYFLNIDLAVDELLDEYLLCLADNNQVCSKINELDSNLLPISILKWSHFKKGTLYSVEVHYKTLRFFEVKKTRELVYEKKVDFKQ